MCLGIPGRVLEVSAGGELLMGQVDFGGLRKEVCLAYVPEVEPGDYVIVHVGSAISQLDEDEAQRTLEVLRQMGDLVEAELAGPTVPDASAPAGSGAVPGSGAEPAQWETT